MLSHAVLLWAHAFIFGVIIRIYCRHMNTLIYLKVVPGRDVRVPVQSRLCTDRKALGFPTIQNEWN